MYKKKQRSTEDRMVEEHKSRSGFTKRKRDRSECACESVGDNFETQYKPITNQKLGSSDRVSIMVMDDKFVEDLITNYRRILDGGRCFSPSSAMRCLKKSITRPYKCKKLREKLSYLHAIHAGRNDDFAGRSYQRFKDKYEDTCFWKDYLHIVEHPDFNRFLAKANSSRSGVGNGSRSRSCNNLSAGAGPSSVNFDNDQDHSCKTVYDIVEKLNMEETTLNRALHAFQSKELRLFFMLLPNDDRRRSFLHDNFST